LGIAASTDALAAAAQLGPFFVLDTDPPPISVADGAPPWRPFADLTDDRAVTDARIDAIRRGIADRGRLEVDAVPRRAAASLAHLGLCARLISPSMAAVLLGGVLPDLRNLWWRDVLGPVPMTLPDAHGEAVDAGDPAAVADALSAQFRSGPVAALTDAIAGAGRVSARLLWGNVASAAAGAVRMFATAAPSQAAVAFDVGRRLVDQAPLLDSGGWTGTAFRRSTCCLYYRVPGGGYCGDCVLLERERKP
jgi:hypothetical protein